MASASIQALPSSPAPRLQPRQRAGRTAVLLNANAKRVTPRVRRAIETAAPDAEIFFTDSLEQAAFVTRRVADLEYDTVLTGGGDGTVAHTINAILDRVDELRDCSAPQFGVLRLGTGNAIADFLGASDFRTDLRNREAANVRAVDVVRVDGVRTLFAGFGWDAHILNNYEYLKRAAQRFAISRLAFKSVLGYLIAGVGKSAPELVFKRPTWNMRAVNTGGLAFRLDREGKVVERFGPGATIFEGPVKLACFGTTPYYGFKFNIMPFAHTAPGMCHLRVIDMHPMYAVTHLRQAWKGTLDHPGLNDFHVSACRLEFDGDAPFQISGDAAGERRSVELSVADRPLECLDFT